MSSMLNSLDELSKSLCDDEYQVEYENQHNSGYLYKSLDYPKQFFQQLKYHQESANFYDVILRSKVTSTSPNNEIVNSKNDIKAHKIILASASEYFRAQFTDGFNDSNKNIVSLDVNYEILRLIVNYIYTGELLIKDMTQISLLLPAAAMLQVNGVINICCSFLKFHLNPSNCIGIYEFAYQNGCMTLYKYAEDFFCRNCAEVLQSDEFLNLDESQLCHLLGRDELKIPCESIVFRAMVDWVKYDPEKRRASMDCLFKCVRCHYLPPQFLREQIKNCDILKFQEAQRMVNNITRVIDDLISHKPCPYSGRKPNVPLSLYVIGGYQRKSINVVECFKFNTNQWEKCAEMSYARSGIAVVTHAFYIYAIGGRNNSTHGNVDCSHVEYYDPIMNIWRPCAPMSVPRSRAGAAVIDGLIYVCGGAYDTQYHSSVEKYCRLTNQWFPVQSMLIPRLGLGCVSLNRLLYAIGGYDGFNRLNQVECYNPETNAWQSVASMNVARSGIGFTTLENSIYVVGGYTAEQQLNSAERYDSLTNQWTMIASMSLPRSALSCVTWNGKIYAIGGYTGRDFLSKIETYDPKEDKWTETIGMSSERSGHGAAISLECI